MTVWGGGLVDGQLEDSIAKVCGDVLRGHPFGYTNGAREAPKVTLLGDPIVSLVLASTLTLPADCEQVVLQLDIHILLLHAGQLALHAQLVPTVVNVHGWEQAARGPHTAAPVRQLTAAPEIVKLLVQAALHLLEGVVSGKLAKVSTRHGGKREKVNAMKKRKAGKAIGKKVW